MTYLEFQKKIFKGHLEDGEDIFFVAHKHWIEIVDALVVLIGVGLFLPWFLWIFLGFDIWINLACHLAFLCYFVYKSMDWYLDAWLITSLSVIDVEWHGLFHRESSRVDYIDLKEVTYEIQGILSTFLNYGVIHIHLNSGGSVDLEHANNPRNVELMVKRYKDKFLQSLKMTDAASIQEILADVVRDHIIEHGYPHRKKLGKRKF